jgi:hypothetical protein
MALAMASNPGTHRNQKPETRPSVLAAAARDRIRNGKRTRQPHKAPAGRLRGCCMMHQAKQTAQPLNLHSLQAVRRRLARPRGAGSGSASGAALGVLICFHLVCVRLAG